MIDLKLDEENDLIINHTGDFELINNEKEYYKQKIKLELNTFYSEWFLDSEVGLAWHEMLGNKDFDEAKLNLYLKKKIEEIDGVKEVEIISSDLNREKRQCNLSLKIKSKNEIIKLNNIKSGNKNG
ncbi:hypothetical protein GCL60_16600 [Silvanigrella paludirubra]|uniref:DUF2634 domain-containing protein n=1 Tax=Silvanigrella paludirubra TaxID=2499159 RepID=A0A6N6VSS5_9BACT|nr:hypothetical protein [Silvanigrella paludirubra]KAB8035849.1 hypothetical protein GCL60_16600 [Silvanigrella paludirubra]